MTQSLQIAHIDLITLYFIILFEICHSSSMQNLKQSYFTVSTRADGSVVEAARSKVQPIHPTAKHFDVGAFDLAGKP